MTFLSYGSLTAKVSDPSFIVFNVSQVSGAFDHSPERTQWQLCELEELFPEGDAYDGYAKDKPCQKIAERKLNAAEQEPDYV